MFDESERMFQLMATAAHLHAKRARQPQFQVSNGLILPTPANHHHIIAPALTLLFLQGQVTAVQLGCGWQL
jgi:hypothetical protein